VSLGLANASPSKEFFVRTLIRDIALDDCIFDLVDNSIDGARESLRAKEAKKAKGRRKKEIHPYELQTSDKLKDYSIRIQISPDKFEIRDNSGGITLDEAAERAFNFGRQNSDVSDDWSVGVYGIGMKRAVFKLGNSIKVQSTYLDGGQVAAFEVPITVNEWVQEEAESWDFPIEESEPMDECGVAIIVEELSEETVERFLDPTYEVRLRTALSRIYMLPLMHGLSLKVNGIEVPERKMEFRSGDSFAPMRSSYDDGEVVVELVAGMLFPPPDDSAPDASSREDRDSGWYVICNGRVVLDADRTHLSVWGANEFPRWHLQYSGFVGMILFSATNPLALPMTSTKRGVDVSSGVYRRALVRMREPTRAWIDYTNQRKLDVKAAKEEERTAKPVSMANIATSEAVRLPSLSRVTSTPMANINYAVPRARLRKLARGLGNANLTYRDVGLRSFDYAYDELVVEDDDE
jgi:hypothetical protein